MNSDKSKQYAADLRSVMLRCSGVSRVFWLNAPESKTFPYVVFSFRDAGAQRKVIELDLWGTKGNETDLWDMADALEAELDGHLVCNSSHSSDIFSNTDKKWVADDDERIIRINMSFTATYQS